MERLWTPWRMAFVSTADDTPGCFLCQKSAEDQDVDNLILIRAVHSYAILNLYPYNSAHTLVAPYRHTGDYGALDGAITAELTELTQRLVRAISAEYQPEGFNVGMNLGRVAGAGVPDHLHVHIVPRWGGDTNFMPVTADTKVLPESLAQTYRRLHQRLLG